MASRGKVETEKLRKNLEEQLDRLVEQLEDLEECRNELDLAEYEETKNETMEQLKEFNESLQRMISGDVTLIDHLGAMQLATQAAISAAFKTPAVIRMFGKREPNLLRERLSQVNRDLKLGKLDKDIGQRQRGEILSALKQLGENLEPAELQLIEQLSVKGLNSSSFVKVNENSEKGQMALVMASMEVRANQET
ncbi:protein LZIC [Orussus abietinus]|uniref:protein LZIC n=1 Tax=Orussus abietinus TaxID=222816 RepID=UPI000625F8CB|nr:protein LZIC [Orussus abietinus]XP_012270995.1 protein LZIC [Orussus abietinus]